MNNNRRLRRACHGLEQEGTQEPPHLTEEVSPVVHLGVVLLLEVEPGVCNGNVIQLRLAPTALLQLQVLVV